MMLFSNFFFTRQEMYIDKIIVNYNISRDLFVIIE